MALSFLLPNDLMTPNLITEVIFQGNDSEIDPLS